MNKTLYAILISCIVVSCRNANSYTDTALVTINVPKLNFEDSFSLFDDWKTMIDTIIILPLEKREGALLGEVTKTIVKDSTIYLLDSRKSKKIVSYNINTGEYITNIGSVGNALNEFISPFDFFSVNKDVCVYDRSKRKVLTYNEEGVFQCTTNLKYHAMNVVKIPDENAYWSISRYNNTERIKNYQLIKTDAEGNLITGISHSFGDLNIDTPKGLSVHDGKIVFHPYFNRFLFYVVDSTLEPFIEVKFSTEALPDDVAKLCSNSMDNFMEDYYKNYTQLESFFLLKDYVIIDYYIKQIYYRMICDIKTGKVLAHGSPGIDSKCKNADHIILCGAQLHNASCVDNCIYTLINLSESMASSLSDEQLAMYNINRTDLVDQQRDYVVKVVMK
ncbi:MAG: 6-bladed beta-propeller [Marinifilaceae bacterium]